MKPYYDRLVPGELPQAIQEFGALLDGGASEGKLQTFLESHAYFLLLAPPVYDHFIALSQPHLGAEFRADFALYGSCNGPWWTLVELEPPSEQMFTKAGDPSARLTHAMRQVRDWRAWITDNREYFATNYPDDMSFGRCHINTGIIIGRRKDLDRPAAKHLLQINQENRYDWIMTYDGILERVRRMYRLRDGVTIHRHSIPFSEYRKIASRAEFSSFAGAARRALNEAELDDFQDRVSQGRQSSDEGVAS